MDSPAPDSAIIAAATFRAIREAEITLPPDVRNALRDAVTRETAPVARGELENILSNISLAGEIGVPLCQDTGILVLFVTVPQGMPWNGTMLDAIHEGVRKATREIPLRPNVVHPLTRENTGDNTGLSMPPVHVRPGDRFTITVLPKGAGSENVSRLTMLLPSERGSVIQFVTETVLRAGGRPCPPVIVGVGIGGTFDGAALLAKEALLLPVDRMDPFEQQICDSINLLGIGPMGLGGDTTALAVRVLTAGCHTASLPVAVNIQCWACRRATVEVPWKRE